MVKYLTSQERKMIAAGNYNNLIVVYVLYETPLFNKESLKTFNYEKYITKKSFGFACFDNYVR